MAFFDALNGNVPRPKYMRGAELPLFVPLKIMNVSPAVTVVGPTTKIEAEMGTVRIFFYLNAEDHQKIVENDGVAQLMTMVNSHQNPFCFAIKKLNRVGMAYAPLMLIWLPDAKRKVLSS
ncbi:Phosphatidylglycerol--prolipoprotein diacylglyceryl transferase [Frankliniella fusca]|uniref:Phosphatidylglycerol--prolipoprotein diacylglyceryl transferase n=1 Tax=Frankliniella fusca TaxID=407009 RepID=A0AAE1I0I5_9NEOP|nr:Phosphatidylglycerol--prolipoprotein diacylglyceryl transferase [Frankliniella fusca]